MSEQDETGNPQYAEGASVAFEAKYAALVGATEQGVQFVASGPNHRIGSGWIVAVEPVLTRKGDLEPVYVVRVYWLDGEKLPDDQYRYIYLGEPEITKVFGVSAESEA